jgi:membrane-associated phospholipid phosphatase
MKQILKNNSLYFGLYLFIWSLVLIWILNTSKFEQMTIINNHYSWWADYFFVGATQLGEGWFFGAVIIIFLGIKFYQALMLTASLAIGSVLSVILKFSFDTPRPHLFFAGKNIPWHLVDGLTIHIHNSFPSGHTITAFSIATLLVLFHPNKHLSVIFLILACLAGYSRCYLFQHFPEDVLAGSFIGILSSLVVFVLIGKMMKVYPKKWYKRNLLFRTKS